jgi:hypothetical protein
MVEGVQEMIQIPQEENLDELYEKINLLKAEVASILTLFFLLNYVDFVEMKDSREEVKGTMRRELNRRIRFSLPKMELTYPQKEEICKLVSSLTFYRFRFCSLFFRFKNFRRKIFLDC